MKRVLLVLLLAGLPAGAAEHRAPDPVSARLCDALQGVPERRKAECCTTTPARGLATECTDELAASRASNAIAVDARDVDRCAADTARALERCDWVTPYLPPPPASCKSILHGRLDAGATCRSSLECRDGLRCAGTRCVAPGEPGAPCSGAPDPLATITRQTDDARHPECTGYCFRGRCAAPVAVGGDCSADPQCVAGSHCAARRCVAGSRPALGEPCAGASCADGLGCVAGTCVEPKANGEACTQPSDCRATCLGAAPDHPGTCGTRCSAWPPAGYTPPVASATP